MTGLLALAAGTFLLAIPGLALPAILGIPERATFAIASLVSAAGSIVGISIALSLADGFTRGGILAGQAALAALAALAWVLRGRPRPPTGWRPPSGSALAAGVRDHPAVTLLAAAAGFALVLQAVIGVTVAPNNWDSMSFHLSRAAYWLQEASVTQFPEGTSRQLGSPPGAEILQAWTMALTGTDRAAALVQWAALVGLGGTTWAGARLLGFPRPAALFAASLLVVLPQPILQASSTQNDLVVSFFVASTACFAVRGLRDGRAGDLVIAGASAGLAVGTKGTTVVAAPSLVLIVAAAIRGYRPPGRLLLAGAAWALAGVIALGAFNYVLNVKNTRTLLGRSADAVTLRSGRSPAENLIRNGWTFADMPGMGVPWLEFAVQRPARAAFGGLESGRFVFDVDVSVQEDTTAFGPVGFFVLIPLLGIVAFGPRSPPARRVLALAALGYLALACIRLGYNPWLGRVLLPGVALAAPLFALLAARSWLRTLTVILALAGLLPCLFTNLQKPLLVEDGRKTVFSLDRVSQQTLSRPHMERAFRGIDRLVSPTAPLGFAGGGDSWDYPLFGEHRERRVVRVAPNQVNYETIRREDLAGIAVFDIGQPRGVRSVQLEPGYYFVPR